MQSRIVTLNDQLLFGTNLRVELMLAVEFDPVSKAIGAMHVAQLVLATDPYIKLFVRDGLDGATIELADDEIDTPGLGSFDPERPAPCDPVYRRTFTAILNSSAFCAYVSSATLSTVMANPNWSLYGSTLDRWYSGFSLNALKPPADSEELHVDDWALRDVYDNNPDCEFCACGCGDYVMPGELTVTLHADGCLSSVDGSTATLYWDRLTQRWQGEMVTACVSWIIGVSCPAMVPPFVMGDFTLQISVHPTEPPGGSCYASDPCAAETSQSRKASPASTCNPLDLLFGAGGAAGCWYDPWKVACSDLDCAPCCPGSFPPPPGTCAEFWFEVTA
jgi:hypothetical protein